MQAGGVGIGGLSAANLSAAGVATNTQINAYYADGSLYKQTLDLLNGSGTSANVEYDYDGAGRLAMRYLNSRQGTAYTNGYQYVYATNNARLATAINGYRMGDNNATRTLLGSTAQGYDANGYLVYTQGQNGPITIDTRNMVNDAQGRVLKKTETVSQTMQYAGSPYPGVGTHVTTTLIANGEVIGSSSGANSLSDRRFAAGLTRPDARGDLEQLGMVAQHFGLFALAAAARFPCDGASGAHNGQRKESDKHGRDQGGIHCGYSCALRCSMHTML
jgi:hypothetical protein